MTLIHCGDLSGVAATEQLSEGLAHAFRSEQTPPFANLLSHLFLWSASQQRSNVVNTLIGPLGPTSVAEVLARGGAIAAAKELRRGNATISADAAEDIPFGLIEELARDAETHDPLVVDRISRLYADRLALVRTLGHLVMKVILVGIAERTTRLRQEESAARS